MPKNKLTIGYLLDDTLDVSDGVQQAMITIAEKMRAKGHDVHYIVSKTVRKDLKNVHSITNNFSLKFNGNSVRTPYPASRSRIKELFSEVDFDVIHVQMPYSPFFAARVIKLAPENVKIFGTFHILPYNKLSTIGTKLLSIFLSKSHKRIFKSYAVSYPALNFMYKGFNLVGDILPNPVDYEFYKSAKVSYKTEKISVVFVGRFDERKGVMQLVKAYELLNLETKSKIKLTLCGKGPLHKKVSDYVSDKKLDIELTGFISETEKAERLSSADIAIFPSISGESFGIVLTEAMSAGAGVTLGGRNPGYESVLNEWQVSLFDARDPEKIKQKLQEFIEDKKLRNHIGKLQHESARQYDVNLIVDKLLIDYRS